jgi:hypothetical protein
MPLGDLRYICILFEALAFKLAWHGARGSIKNIWIPLHRRIVKNFAGSLVLLTILFSCDSQEIMPQPDMWAVLSGDDSNGKRWRMTSFKSVSNYCTSDVKKFESTELWDSYPESIKDNVTIIYPDGKIEVDEGSVKFSDDSPQLYLERQFWTINSKQDSVTILDYVGLPSINSRWGLRINRNTIELSYKELNALFRGSELSYTVTFID